MPWILDLPAVPPRSVDRGALPCRLGLLAMPAGPCWLAPAGAVLGSRKKPGWRIPPQAARRRIVLLLCASPCHAMPPVILSVRIAFHELRALSVASVRGER